METDRPTFKFYTDTVSFKTADVEGEPEYFVEGYISTKSLDLVGDIVSQECLRDMLEQVKSKNIKLDVEHEAWTKSTNLIPVGRIVEARLDEKGLFVKALLNKHVSNFTEIWHSIKNKFFDAFSIAYKAVEAIPKTMGERMVRVLNKVELLNVALTGIPANPECSITNVFTKSLDSIPAPVETNTEATMAEEVPQAPVEVKAEPAPPIASPPVEAKALMDELATLKAELAELKTARENDNTARAELKGRLDAAEKALTAPQIKSPDVIAEAKALGELERKQEVLLTPLQLIR
jgi:HK97 family phage prohead protease